MDAAVFAGSAKIHPNGSLSLSLLCLLPFYTCFTGGRSKQAVVTVSMNTLRSAELPHEWAPSAQVLSANRSWWDGRLLEHLQTVQDFSVSPCLVIGILGQVWEGWIQPEPCRKSHIWRGSSCKSFPEDVMVCTVWNLSDLKCGKGKLPHWSLRAQFSWGVQPLLTWFRVQNWMPPRVNSVSVVWPTCLQRAWCSFCCA